MGDMVSEFFEAIIGAIGSIASAMPKVVSFILWVFSALIVLPCVFIAGQWYPRWVEWGEGF